MAKTNKARYRTDLIDRCEFLSISFGGPFPSNSDMSSALRKKTGTLNFSQYLVAQDLTQTWRMFRKDKAMKKHLCKVSNVSSKSSVSVEGNSGTKHRVG